MRWGIVTWSCWWAAATRSCRRSSPSISARGCRRRPTRPSYPTPISRMNAAGPRRGPPCCATPAPRSDASEGDAEIGRARHILAVRAQFLGDDLKPGLDRILDLVARSQADQDADISSAVARLGRLVLEGQRNVRLELADRIGGLAADAEGAVVNGRGHAAERCRRRCVRQFERIGVAEGPRPFDRMGFPERVEIEGGRVAVGSEARRADAAAVVAQPVVGEDAVDGEVVVDDIGEIRSQRRALRDLRSLERRHGDIGADIAAGKARHPGVAIDIIDAGERGHAIAAKGGDRAVIPQIGTRSVRPDAPILRRRARRYAAVAGRPAARLLVSAAARLRDVARYRADAVGEDVDHALDLRAHGRVRGAGDAGGERRAGGADLELPALARLAEGAIADIERAIELLGGIADRLGA